MLIPAECRNLICCLLTCNAPVRNSPTATPSIAKSVWAGFTTIGFELRVLRLQHDFAAAPLQALDGHLVAGSAGQAGDDDLARARVGGAGARPASRRPGCRHPSCSCRARAEGNRPVARTARHRPGSAPRRSPPPGPAGRRRLFRPAASVPWIGTPGTSFNRSPATRPAPARARPSGQRLQMILRRSWRWRNPRPAAISARVGGMPLDSMKPRIQSRICCWRASVMAQWRWRRRRTAAKVGKRAAWHRRICRMYNRYRYYKRVFASVKRMRARLRRRRIGAR